MRVVGPAKGIAEKLNSSGRNQASRFTSWLWKSICSHITVCLRIQGHAISLILYLPINIIPDFFLKRSTQLINPVPPGAPAESDADCEKFLLHFVGKVENIRISIRTNPSFTDVSPPYRDTLSIFTPISLPELLKIISNMRVSSSPLDIIPTKFLIEIKECIGPHLLTILNSSLSAGCVPDYFKTACIQQSSKNLDLIPLSSIVFARSQSYLSSLKSWKKLSLSSCWQLW